ncbi:MAG: hypothetical protein AB7L13_24230 [Acidimicrobiia bacterium]
MDDVSDADLDIRRVQPYEAIKRYLCPGCLQDIEPGLGHYVVVPKAAPDMRRHWHKACWEHRGRRRPGRTR